MIQSMTGYGKAEALYGQKKIHAEVKSLNSKNLDLTTRVPAVYHAHEMELRHMAQKRLLRGKVELTVWLEKEASEQMPAINAEAVAAYVEQMRTISAAQGLPLPADLWPTVLSLPSALQNGTEEEEVGEEEWSAVERCVEQALNKLIAFRTQEGEALCRMFLEKIGNIEQLMHDITPYEESRTEKIRERLEARLAALEGIDYDRSRLEQELIYYIEKLDISEEKQRLTNHLAYFRETLDGEPGQGKKLGFIAQEMGREINTTGSKSNQAEMQNIVVKMKDELEQIKEQVLNVL